MSKERKTPRELSVEDILEAKRVARVRLIDALYAADRDSLELAGEYIKAALCGNSSISRPKRFSSLSKKA